MFNLQICLLTISIGVLGGTLPMTDLKCTDYEECIPSATCQQFVDENKRFEQMTKGTREWQTQLEKLKDVVCNKKGKGVCCEKNPTVGRFCLTMKGDSGSCQTRSGCSQSNSVYSQSCGPDYTCCEGKEAEENNVSIRSGNLPPGKPGRPGICGLEDEVEPYVFGGTAAKPGQFPFVASLVWTSKYSRKITSFCGGVLITSRHVLTAAHCFNSVKASDLKNNAIDVRIGLSNLRTREKPGNSANIVKIKIHESYRRRGVGVENDIAIVTLDRDVNGVTVCLPTEYRSWRNTSAVVVGWGRDTRDTRGSSGSQLRYANLKEYPISVCQRKYDTFLERNSKKAILTNKQLCAGNEKADACAGDSGGPLLHLNSDYLWMVAGIVSYGPSSCAREVPGVYTKVASYLDWIDNEITVE